MIVDKASEETSFRVTDVGYDHCFKLDIHYIVVSDMGAIGSNNCFSNGVFNPRLIRAIFYARKVHVCACIFWVAQIVFVLLEASQTNMACLPCH